MTAYSQVTLAQFEAQVFQRLGPTAFWTTSEVQQNINAALRTWNALTGFWSSTITFGTTGQFPYYALPAALTFGARVLANALPIQQSSLFAWDQQDPNWMATRDVPVEWSPVGIGIIALRPVPMSSGITITVDGVAMTPTLSAPSDFINIGEEEFSTLVDYILHVLSFKEGGMDFATTIPLHKAFLAAAAVRNEKLRASRFYRRIMGLDQTLQQKPWRRKAADDVVIGVR